MLGLSPLKTKVSGESKGSLMSSDNIFSKRTFQEKVVQALLLDKMWAQNFIEILNVNESFDYAPLKVLATEYVGYYTKYKEFPSIELLKMVVSDNYSEPNDLLLRTQSVAILEKIEKGEDISDLSWVKERAFEFCKQQNLKKALRESAELVGTDNYEKVIDIMKNAIAAGLPNSTGHDYWEDFDARYSETYRNCVSTGLWKLDEKKIMNGGLGAGEIGVVVAPSGVGKSHILVHLGASAMLQKKNVIYYTLELSERLVGIRFDSHISDIPSSDCIDNKQQVRDIIAPMKEHLGRLIVKEYPTRSITVNTIKNHIERQSYKGFRPDLIIIDYAGILRSTEKFDLPRLEMQYIVQEMRRLAKELQIPVWTALQANRQGAKEEIIDITSLSESFGPAMEADFIVGLQRPREKKFAGFGNIFIAKNRFGIDGVRFPIQLDTSRSKLVILEQEDGEGNEEGSDDGSENGNESNSFKRGILETAKESIRKRKEKLSFNKIGSGE
jgi:RecA/RadA recombinase